MRRSRLLLVWLLILALLAAACGDDDDDGATGTTSGGEEPAVEGGELRVSITGVREQFDPIATGANMKTYMAMLFDPLIGVDLEGAPDTETGLATQWEYSDDNETLTVTIREGVTFHNGEALTADDVKFTIDRVLSEESLSSWSATFRNTIDSVEVVDDTTVRFNFSRPDALFHYWLTRLDGTEGFIVPKDYVEGGGDLNAAPVGSGPYKFVSTTPGAEIVYEAYEDYWRGRPRFDRLVVQNVEEASTRINQLRAGETDFIDLPRDLADSLSGDFNIISSPVTSHLEVWLFNQWEGMFTDERVREAMNIAIDRQAIIDNIFAGRAALPNFYPMTTVAIGYEGPADIPYDPERARQLIQEAGVEGETVTLNQYGLGGIGEAPQMLQAVAGFWEAIGLRVEIVPTEFPTIRNQMVERDSSLAGQAGWMRTAPLQFPAAGMRILDHSEGLLTLHQDPTIDEFVTQMEAAADADEYADLVQQATDYIAGNHLRHPIAEAEQLYAGNPDKIPADYNMGRYTSDIYLNGLFFD